ncbi:MAG: hypothetical protein OEW00_04890 [candidate division Zixibacteria bacterium]|nr:hypothetical protein [candidate division Zixibacteria bacterium]
MRFVTKGGLILAIVLILPAIGWSQVDNLGNIDTIYADLAKINDLNWTITVNYTNDEEIEGLSVPLKMTAGLNRILADSAIYTGGRVEHFTYRGFRADTAIQCITLGMVANLGPTNNYLARGSGRLVTIFVSSVENKPIEKLVVDTTTTEPNNSLLIIPNRLQYGEKVDTIPQSRRKDMEIIPAFVVRYSE